MKMIKRITISLLFAVAFFSQVSANDADLFSYNKTTVQAAGSELSALETYVNQNSFLGVTELLKTGSLMVNGLNMMSSPFSASGGEPPLGIPSFLWGCAFGVIGLLVVYVATDKDSVEVKKAMWGCVTAIIVEVVFYIIVVSASLNSGGA